MTKSGLNFETIKLAASLGLSSKYALLSPPAITEIASAVLNVPDGDFNFIFVGTPGTYTFTINAIDKTITLE